MVGAGPTMKRAGSVKRSVLTLLVTIVIGSSIVVGIWFAGDSLVKSQREETTKKMREHDAEFVKTMTKGMGKGSVLVHTGFKILPNGTVQSGPTEARQGPEKKPTVSINWAVPDADLAQITEGMSVEEVAGILQMAAIHYIPHGPNDRFTLVCRQGNRTVMLVFGGTPNVKLLSKSAVGAP